MPTTAARRPHVGQPGRSAARARPARPVKPEMSRGSVRVAAAASRPPVLGCLPVMPRRLPARGPRRRTARALRSGQAQRLGQQPARVCGRAVALIPRSRSLIDRGLRLAASASSSCVSPAYCRAAAAAGGRNPSAGPSATASHPSLVPSRRHYVCCSRPGPGTLQPSVQASRPFPHRRWSKASRIRRSGPPAKPAARARTKA